jgi:hypothetical protein
LGVSSNVRKLLFSRATVSFFKKAFLQRAFQIFDDELHDYVPIFHAAGTKHIVSKIKDKKEHGVSLFFSDAAYYGTSRVISC